ncbi:MAG: phage minor head protein [Deferribacterales bacterium]
MSSIELMELKEAVEFWGGKTPLPVDEFKALTEVERQRAFTVSGISSQDALASIYQQIGSAVKDGLSYEDFKNSDVWEKTGFQDKGYRIDNIFRTNMQSSLMAGRYASLRKSKLKEYWMYSAVNDSRTRPAHTALHGKVYHRDHAFWITWFPVNGYRCRCGVRAYSAAQVKRMELHVEQDDLTGQVIDVVHPETGEVSKVKLIPDAGFAGNPAEGLAQLSPSEATDIKDLTDRARCRKDFADDCRIPLKDIDPKYIIDVKDTDIMPKGLKPEEYAEAFLNEFNLKMEGSAVITVPGMRLPFVISKTLFIDKQTGLWKIEKSGREQYMKPLAWTIQNPFEVWSVPAEVANKPMAVARLLKLFKTSAGQIGGFGVFNLAGSRYLPATVFAPNAEKGSVEKVLKYLEKQRVGVLSYRQK